MFSRFSNLITPPIDRRYSSKFPPRGRRSLIEWKRSDEVWSKPAYEIGRPFFGLQT
jgi:hypothetical protein